VQVAGERLAQKGRLVLYRIDPPMRLATHLGGVFPDSWMGGFAALTHYATPSSPGRIYVRVSREAWGGESPAGHVTIKAGPLVIKNAQPTIGEPASSRTWTVQSGRARSFILPTPRSPFRVEINIDPTFSPATYGQADGRQLGAQVELRYVS
jgi:hypothetical protein